MSWFEKIMPSRIKTERRTRSVPEGLWIKCPACDAVLYRAELERNLYVCPKCSHHMRIGAPRAAGALPRSGRRSTEIGADVTPEDPLKFRDSKRYKDRLAQAQKATGETRCADRAGRARCTALPIVACAFEFQFLGGSMGSVVGERFKRGVDHCIEHRAPFVCFSASGGARMQEALYSLHADGQDQRRAVAPGAGASAVHLGHDRSDHGRCVGEPRDARAISTSPSRAR